MLRFGMRRKRTLFGFFLLGTIFLSLGATGIAAETTYEVALEKGTEIYIVNQYNDEKWEDTFGDELKTDDWFEGDSDEIGAKSKITFRNVGDYKWDTFDVLMTIFDILDAIPKDLLLNNDTLRLMVLFSEDFIEKLYPDKFSVWEAITVKWNYETEEFDETPDEKINTIPVFKDIKDFEDMLENYNEWAMIININMTLLGLEPYPIMDGDDFLWELILSGKLAIARPFNKYLKEMIDRLDVDDVEVKDNTLIIDRKEEEDYTVEVSFNDQGIMSSFIVKNEDERVIYEIIIDDTYDIVLIVLIGITAAVLAGIVGIIIVLTKRTKEFKE